MTDNGVAQLVPGANVRVDELRGEAFAKATWASTKKLGVEFGLRLEASRIGSAGDVVLSKTLVYPKPRLLLTWSPSQHDQFRLRLEREVGQLDFAQFVSTSSFSTGQVRVGKPNLGPQQAWVAEGTWERHFAGNGAAVVTLRHSSLTDVIDRAPVLSGADAFDTPANIGNGREDEVIVDISFDAAGLPAFDFFQPTRDDDRTHHTVLDTYERLPESDLKRAAVVLASLIYRAAQSPMLVPRRGEPSR